MSSQQPQNPYAEAFLADIRIEFRKVKKQADDAIAQVPAQAWFVQIDEESNSIAMLMKHMGGNLRSRWTDFLTSDGEKPDRRRDDEFVIGEGDTAERITALWEEGWRCVLGGVDALVAGDLSREIIIRAEPAPVGQAILRSLTHAAAHVGQIVLLAKHLQGADWKTLSIARGQSEQFNREMLARLRASGVARG